MDNRPVGVFDSGLGGLTAARVLEEIMPDESIIYFGDSERMPYGEREKEEIAAMSVQDADFLNSLGVKAFLIACGTISSNAIDVLRESFAPPFFGVVDSACKAAAAATRTKRVGVIATMASIRSGVYERGIRGIDADINVFSQACIPFASMVEQGHFRRGDALAEKTVAEQLKEIRDMDVDTLLLGCTHYPPLAELISEYMGGITLVSAGTEAAKELKDYLTANNALADGLQPPRREWYTSGDAVAFGKIADSLLGHHIEPRVHIIKQ